MKHVIIRDDDTSALTPLTCLERLYRPFLDRGFPVSLATIPRVRTDATNARGEPEGFLFGCHDHRHKAVAIGDNTELVGYLRANPGYRVVQHGYDHSLYEFNSGSGSDLRHRLAEGAELLAGAGLGRPATFVAPYDKYSRAGAREVARRFQVFSTGWFELRRLPATWWPQFAMKKLLRRRHWRVGRTLLLSHPGCLLSRFRPRAPMFETIKKTIAAQTLTVLVTHGWEYFAEHKPDESLIRVLHETAEWLGTRDDVKVISFDELISGKVPLA